MSDSRTSPHTSRTRGRVALRFYRLALWAYPASFRRAYGDELAQTFRDMYEEAQASGSTSRMVALWMVALADLLVSASGERISAMRPGIVITASLTGLAFIVSLLATLNLYLLEDQNALTAVAYRASPLLRVSYDAAYLSALVAGALVCGIVARALAPTGLAAYGIVGAVALLVALGGFGGLLIRAPLAFAALFGAFTVLTVLGLLASAWTSTRLSARLGARPAAIVGACVGAGVAVLVNAAALAPHTIALNPVSHALYMQGMIPGSHLNSLLIGMAAQALVVCLLVVALALTLRGPRHRLA